MRFTRRPAGPQRDVRRRSWRTWLLVIAVIVSTGLIFELDAATGSAPFQHLYYVPIIVAALWLPRFAGALVAIVAVLLYHLANPVLLTARYRESDVVQIALFLAIGLVTAKLAEDRRQLHRLSITDDLTGLLNLRGFEDLLAKSIRTVRTTGAPISLLVLDVDRLKSLNDTYGHIAGADAVRTVGHIIATRLPSSAYASRFGGDEFVIALPGQTLDEAQQTAQTLRAAVHAAAPRLANIEFPRETLSISIGLACLPQVGALDAQGALPDSELGESLFRTADQALYVAKTTGRNRVSAA